VNCQAAGASGRKNGSDFFLAMGRPLEPNLTASGLSGLLCTLTCGLDMRLFIAEKPKMGQAIAAQLPGPHVKKDGHIETGGGIVSWCVGHLLEQLMPEHYDAQFAKWKLEDLPIVPTSWKLQVSDSKKKQAGVLRDLLKKCSEVVNAGDPGREGQLIVDEVLELYGNKKPVLRLLLNSLDAPAVKKALAGMRPNSEFEALYQAALGRQRADWMMGINLTRAYTVIGRKQGYPGVLSVGRVQTPTLAIVVRRDLEIENFVPQEYWSVKVQFVDPGQPSIPFWAESVPLGKAKALEVQNDNEDEDEETAGETAAAGRPLWIDGKGRIIELAQAQRIARIGKAGPAVIIEAEKKPAKEAPPLPFELTGLQSAMNSRHGIGVQETLDACQTLYEKGYASYPRTDCTYLPVSQHAEAGMVTEALARALPELSGGVAGADLKLVSAAWNDAKMGEHHAIIPTGQAPRMDDLSSAEKLIYRAISMRYLALFYPDCEVEKSKIVVDSGGEIFAARGKIIVRPGWRVIFSAEPAEEEDSQKDSAKKNDDKAVLPALSAGQSVNPLQAEVGAHKTAPPPRYTQGTLLLAMQHVSRLVKDPAERKKLKNIDGIGRSATRAGIIGTLIQRALLESQKKTLVSSATARMLIHALPLQVSDPGLTARWEQALDGIASGTVPLSTFEQRQEAWVRSLIQQAIAQPLPSPPPEVLAMASKMQAGRATSKGKSTSRASSGKAGTAKSTTVKKPSASATKGGSSAGAGEIKAGDTCPVCKTGQMRERSVRAGAHAGKTFLGCSRYPECNHSLWPK
jgi:DNA topoisomerase-3